jgi:hypothetical protein
MSEEKISRIISRYLPQSPDPIGVLMSQFWSRKLESALPGAKGLDRLATLLDSFFRDIIIRLGDGREYFHPCHWR